MSKCQFNAIVIKTNEKLYTNYNNLFVYNKYLKIILNFEINF